MITANGTTDATGRHCLDDGAFGGLTCKTETLKIDKNNNRGSGLIWPPNLKSWSYREQKLGDLFDSRYKNIDLIARQMFDDGMGLLTPVLLMYRKRGSRPEEVWTKNYRLKCFKGRVYGLKREDIK